MKRYIGMAIGGLLMLTLSCAPPKYRPLEKISLVSKAERQVQVMAKGDWRSTGIDLKQGEKYEINAEGKWRIGPTCALVGPSGAGEGTVFCWDVGGPVPGWGGAALIARIGEKGEPFGVGDHLIFKADESGILYFRMNDAIRGDNDGYVTAQVRRYYEKGAAEAHVDLKSPEMAKGAVGLGARWAVVIGISEYEYAKQTGLKNLIYADDDALAFKEVLKKSGWQDSHIKVLTNSQATERTIKIALKSWLTKAGPDDVVILYWSGHGFPDPEDPEKVYFACYDTDINVPATGYRMDEVITALKERKVRNVVVIADTCHAGKLITRGDKGVAVRPYVEKLRSEASVPKGWIYMVSADTDRLAIENSSWSNGAFTHCLVKALTGEADGYESVGPKDGTVTMGELRAYLNSAMPDETQKVLGVAKRPVITTSTGDPDIWNLTLQVR